MHACIVGCKRIWRFFRIGNGGEWQGVQAPYKEIKAKRILSLTQKTAGALRSGRMNTQLLANYEVSADDISAVSTCTVQVTDAKGTQLATCNLTVVQIGHTWYVDNTTADTSALYQIGK